MTARDYWGTSVHVEVSEYIDGDFGHLIFVRPVGPRGGQRYPLALRADDAVALATDLLTAAREAQAAGASA